MTDIIESGGQAASSIVIQKSQQQTVSVPSADSLLRNIVHMIPEGAGLDIREAAIKGASTYLGMRGVDLSPSGRNNITQIVEQALPKVLTNMGVSSSTVTSALTDKHLSRTEAVSFLAEIGNSNYSNVDPGPKTMANARKLAAEYGVHDKAHVLGLARFETGVDATLDSTNLLQKTIGPGLTASFGTSVLKSLGGAGAMEVIQPTAVPDLKFSDPVASPVAPLFKPPGG